MHGYPGPGDQEEWVNSYIAVNWFQTLTQGSGLPLPRQLWQITPRGGHRGDLGLPLGESRVPEVSLR